MLHTIQSVILARGSPPSTITIPPSDIPPPTKSTPRLDVDQQHIAQEEAQLNTTSDLSLSQKKKAKLPEQLNIDSDILSTTKASTKHNSSLSHSSISDIIDEMMKFTSPHSKPSLTPVGFKLLHLSERKLSSLDGSEFDEGPALLKGVLVKQAIRSAWESVNQGSILEMNDWTSVSAMGLNVVSEDEEDDYDQDEYGQQGTQGVREERWFEDLVSSFGEDDFDQSQSYQQEEHEWVESNVTEPIFDEFDYDVNGMQAFTFPSPISPTQSPTPKPVSVPQVIVTDVDIVEVDDEDEDDVDEGLSFSTKENPSHHHRSRITSTIEVVPSPSLLPVPSSALVPPSPIEAILSEFDESIYLYPQPYYTDFDDYIDDFSLPPPLIRSLSSSSTNSIDSNEEEEEVCGTPPLRHSELSDQPSWIDQLKNVEDLVVADDESDDDDSEEDGDIGIRRFTEEDGSGKVLGGIVGMALGFNEEGFVL